MKDTDLILKLIDINKSIVAYVQEMGYHNQVNLINRLVELEKEINDSGVGESEKYR